MAASSSTMTLNRIAAAAIISALFFTSTVSSTIESPDGRRLLSSSKAKTNETPQSAPTTPNPNPNPDPAQKADAAPTPQTGPNPAQNQPQPPNDKNTNAAPTPQAGQNPAQNQPQPSKDKSPQELAQEFLNSHNQIRQALKLPPLQWNETLAQHALDWAKKRSHDCQMIHSKDGLGENMAWGLLDKWKNPAETVKSWASEKQFYDLKSKKCSPGHACGHYTQIVWKRTTTLGCAITDCLTKEHGHVIICNYFPSGNWLNFGPLDDYPKLPGEIEKPLKEVGKAVAPAISMIKKGVDNALDKAKDVLKGKVPQPN